MATEKLYYIKPEESKFSATVIDCKEEKDGYAVVLDKTLFYPEGGGQPADIGTIGGTTVSYTYEKEGEILHVVDAFVEKGTNVDCVIDWKRRFCFMQNHTGEHILSGIINSLFGYDNIGFHMGAECTTLDINGELTEEQLLVVEEKANYAIYKNIKIEATYPQNLDAISYRSKKALEGDVRIVSIAGYDACACCGLHTSYTGQIGIIKILTAQRYKGGMRISILCGEKALRDYIIKNKNAYAISAILSSKVNDIPEAVKQATEEVNRIKQQLAIYKQQIFEYKAKCIKPEEKSVCLFEDEMLPNDLRNFCNILMEKVELASVFSFDGNGYRYAIASKTQDTRELSAKLNKAFNGKGGGQSALVQGTIYGEKNDIISFISNM